MLQQPAAQEITELLAIWAAGRSEPGPELWETVYRELRCIAGAYARNRRLDESLQATALIHEAYIRMFRGAPAPWESRKHFFARSRGSCTRSWSITPGSAARKSVGGAWQRVPLEKFSVPNG